jgi:CheY-like chemotaxis protein
VASVESGTLLGFSPIISQVPALIVVRSGSASFVDLLRNMKNDNTCPTGHPVAAPQQSQTSRSQRILVVDDESAIRLLMSAVLTGSGYHVDTAEDGAGAWKALQAEPYDLLITDHNMPKITGVELVKNLRSANMGLPVVMVAGSLPAHELAQNPSLELAATILKPFALAELLDTVTNVLQMAE